MAFDNKPIWTEGMFIRAQHFQQEARHTASLVRSLYRAALPYGWGWTELRPNRELLSIGRFALERAAGVFADATPFAIPGDADHPPPLVLTEAARGQTVYLTLPVSQPGGFEAADESADALTRFIVQDADIADSNLGESTGAQIRIGKLRLRYALESADRSGLLSLGIARIAEVRADNAVVLDDSYIPPVLDAAVSPVLAGFAVEIAGLLNHRGEAIAGRLSAGSGGAAAEMSDTAMLQAINRWQPLLAHRSTAAGVHPEGLWRDMAQLAGELATFTAAGLRPRAFPAYDHDALQPSFGAVVAAIRQSLSAVLDRGAIPIPLVEHRYGIRLAEVTDRALFQRYVFVLAVKAAVPADVLMRSFVGQVKIGPAEQIRELVNAALPGILPRSLPAAPRQIPYRTGLAYFELDRTSPLWKHVAASPSGLALHVAGDFPGLELELWAVKD